jgi:uncharacterized protein YqjF (DUF2071 family)
MQSKPHQILERADHRPSPLPERPWAMRMTWRDLLFAHWPVSPDVLRPHVPDALDIDTFDGAAWLGVVPFLMDGVRLRAMPVLPGAGAFPELNVRTYVRAGGRSGVWFFSLDAASRLAVRGARAWFGLPYFDARMKVTREGREGTGEGLRVQYYSRRIHRGAASAAFDATYHPTGPAVAAASGSLERWLTERYCLFALDRRGSLRVGDIHHAPWSLQSAEAEIRANTMAGPLGLELPGDPVLHFADRLDVLAWGPVGLATVT